MDDSEQKQLILLNPTEFKVLRVLKLKGHSFNPFIGYLPYLRKFDPEKYDPIQGDALDAQIMKCLQASFSDCSLYLTSNILFENQLDGFLKQLEMASRKQITMQVSPLIPYHEAPSLVGKTFHAYPIGFSLRVSINDSEKIESINDYFICHIPYAEVDDVIKTIQAV